MSWASISYIVHTVPNCQTEATIPEQMFAALFRLNRALQTKGRRPYSLTEMTLDADTDMRSLGAAARVRPVSPNTRALAWELLDVAAEGFE